MAGWQDDYGGYGEYGEYAGGAGGGYSDDYGGYSESGVMPTGWGSMGAGYVNTMGGAAAGGINNFSQWAQQGDPRGTPINLSQSSMDRAAGFHRMGGSAHDRATSIDGRFDRVSSGIAHHLPGGGRQAPPPRGGFWGEVNQVYDAFGGARNDVVGAGTTAAGDVAGYHYGDQAATAARHYAAGTGHLVGTASTVHGWASPLGFARRTGKHYARGQTGLERGGYNEGWGAPPERWNSW